jgi:hypothetical protein
MTPQEFQFASREFHTLLNEPANISSAAEFAEALDEVVPPDAPIRKPEPERIRTGNVFRDAMANNRGIRTNS